MVLKADEIARYLDGKHPDVRPDDPLVITPRSKSKDIAASGAASIDLRLGCWFETARKARLRYLAIGRTEVGSQLTRTSYVPFHGQYVLHPRTLVLAITLEWMRLPGTLAGYVVGKSSWGRRGLIIATAAGVHPGFRGCLTLELNNVGEIPIDIQPGMKICQLFLHEAKTLKPDIVDRSNFVGRRKPHLGQIKTDDFADALARAYPNTEERKEHNKKDVSAENGEGDGENSAQQTETTK